MGRIIVYTATYHQGLIVMLWRHFWCNDIDRYLRCLLLKLQFKTKSRLKDGDQFYKFLTMKCH